MIQRLQLLILMLNDLHNFLSSMMLSTYIQHYLYSSQLQIVDPASYLTQHFLRVPIQHTFLGALL